MAIKEQHTNYGFPALAEPQWDLCESNSELYLAVFLTKSFK